MSLKSKIKNFVWSKKFLLHCILLVIVYFLIIYGTKWYLNSSTHHGEKVPVPNLFNKNVNTIDAQLSQLELHYEILDSIYEPTKIEGTILSQDPLPTDSTTVSIKRGRTIRLRVSKRSRLVEVPQCVDKSQRFAENVLRSRGLKYKVEYKPTTESNGAVMEQFYNRKEVKAKTKIPIGSTIQLIVGRNLGGTPVTLPNLVGLTISEAKTRLDSMITLSLFTVCDGCETLEDSTFSVVESQTPEFSEGKQVSAGSTITVFASKKEEDEND